MESLSSAFVLLFMENQGSPFLLESRSSLMLLESILLIWEKVDLLEQVTGYIRVSYRLQSS